MRAPQETINPTEAFPERYPLYARLRDHTTLSSSPTGHLPLGLTHVQSLGKPELGFDAIVEVERYEKLDDDLSPEETISYYDLELQAYRRTRQLLGDAATQATFPLSITGGQRHSYADVTAKAEIYVCEDERRRKYFRNLDSLLLQITGTCTDAPADVDERFRITASILTNLSQTDRGESAGQKVLGTRLLTLLQFNDALDFIDAHRAQ